MENKYMRKELHIERERLLGELALHGERINELEDKYNSG
jgi:hypothetical protein